MEKGLTGNRGQYFSQNKHPWEGISSNLFPAANLCCIGTSWPLPREEPGEGTRGKKEVGLVPEAATTKMSFLSSNLTLPLIREALGRNGKEQTSWFHAPSFVRLNPSLLFSVFFFFKYAVLLSIFSPK